jgi:hypothetical protein
MMFFIIYCHDSDVDLIVRDSKRGLIALILYLSTESTFLPNLVLTSRAGHTLRDKTTKSGDLETEIKVIIGG